MRSAAMSNRRRGPSVSSTAIALGVTPQDGRPGVPFTQEAGSGGFGPALWDGRPNIQFLSAEDLIEFITEGSVAQAALRSQRNRVRADAGVRSDPDCRRSGT